MTNEGKLWNLIYNMEPSPAPSKRTYRAPHQEFLVGIGPDHTAHITMDQEAYEELIRRNR